MVADAVAHVRERRADPAARTTIVWGSLALAGDLLAAELVDELELFVAPIVLGDGVRLFPPGTPAAGLALSASEAWPSGLVRLRYAVTPAP